jgi:predicted lipoprotein with Yx(FWY)xxD motif
LENNNAKIFEILPQSASIRGEIGGKIHSTWNQVYWLRTILGGNGMGTLAYKTRTYFWLSICAIAALLLAACSPLALGIPEDATETPTATLTLVPVPDATPAPVVSLHVSNSAALGSYLTDDSGFSLYYSKDDTAGTSACSGDCLQTWPGVMTSAAPITGDPSIKGKVGWINQPDGGMQVTYNGMPLYYYSKDNIPGDANGQGAGGKWFVMPLSGALK